MIEITCNDPKAADNALNMVGGGGGQCVRVFCFSFLAAGVSDLSVGH